MEIEAEVEEGFGVVEEEVRKDEALMSMSMSMSTDTGVGYVYGVWR